MDSVGISEITAAPIGRVVAIGGGVVAGALLAALLLLLFYRMRRSIGGPEHIRGIRLLGSVARARPGAEIRRPWYPTAGGSDRHRQMRAVAAALDGFQAPDSIGVTGVAAHPEDLQSLAADLAAVFASSGRRVLLVDANFDRPSTIPEYGSDPYDLADLIAGHSGEDSRALIKRSLAERPEVLTNLTALRAGGSLRDPVAALSGRSFGYLLEAAAELEEIIILALPPAGHPVTRAVSGQITHLLLAVRKHRATQPAVETAASDLADSNAQLLGAVLLEGRRESGREALSGRTLTSLPEGMLTADSTEQFDDGAKGENAETFSDAGGRHSSAAPSTARHADGSEDFGRRDGSAAGVEPARLVPEHAASTRLGRHEASESPRASRAPAHHKDPERGEPVTGRPAQVATEEEDTTIIIDDRAGPFAGILNDERRKAGQRYLVDRILMLLGFNPSQALLEADLVDAEGMIPISAGAGSASAAERLAELLREHEPGRPEALDDVLTAVLTEGAGDHPMQDWMEREFFEAHVRLTDGRPAVWHLSSPHGSFQVLVRGDLFDADRIGLLRAHDVRRTLNRLARLLSEARAADQPTGEIRRSMADIQTFDGVLAALLREDWPHAEDYDPQAAYTALEGRGLIAGRDTRHPAQWP